jgi:hypothetical protein
VAFPTITEKLGSLSATGLAKEATFGTPVTPSTFLPMMSNTMEEEPGWFSPELMMGLRDLHVFNLQGEAKYNGAIAGPIFPSNAMALVAASVGADATVGYGVTGTFASLTSTTVNGSVSAGATTVTVTSATGFATNQQLTIDTGSFQEVRKITNVAGSVVTVADAFAFAHASGVAISTYAPTTISSGSTIVGATTITATSAAGLAVGNIVQIDVNSVSGTTTAECRKITNISTNTLTLDVGLTYAHASGVNISLVATAGPFTHTFVEGASTIPSLTVEKNLGNFQSLQFAGCRVNKFDLKMPVGNTAAEMTADLMGRSVTVLDSPTAISVTNELPFVFTEASLNFYGSLRAETSNVNLVIENGVKETYTYSGQHGPSFLTPVTLHVNGSVDVVWDSLDDATYGDFNRMANQTLGALGFQLQHPSLSSTINFVCPQIALSKYANDVKMSDPIMSSMSFEASRSLSGGAQYTIQATVSNSVYLPY